MKVDTTTGTIFNPMRMACAFFLLVMLLLIGGCGLCENKLVKNEISPNGDYIAVAFIRNCGATTSFSPQVSILKKGENLGDQTGNVFIGNRSEFIDVIWKNESELIINYDVSEEDVFKKETDKYGIRIEYKKNRK